MLIDGKSAQSFSCTCRDTGAAPGAIESVSDENEFKEHLTYHEILQGCKIVFPNARIL